MNSLGNNLILTSYGESHGDVIGGVLDGFPSNFKIDLVYIQKQLSRRRPGQSDITTSRNEADTCIINSGVFKGKTTGAPIHFQIPNKDSKSADYDHLKNVYRPSHADYTYDAKYGLRDYRGGGRSSARVTAGWVAAGALVQDFLCKKYNVQVSAYVKQVGGVRLSKAPQCYSMDEVDRSVVRCPDQKASEEMVALIQTAKKNRDSLGGVIECVIGGVKPGVGNPVFEKLHAKLGHAMLSINAVKGFEVGGGFDMSSMRGSEVNDQFTKQGDTIVTDTNYSGGVQGGISNGMDIVFRVAFKPTATIGQQQSTVTKDAEEVMLEAAGRHDPCVVPRAVPIVETLAALVLGDLIL